jgi:hypothetical protein
MQIEADGVATSGRVGGGGCCTCSAIGAGPRDTAGATNVRVPALVGRT